jgi:hypothetical protein
MPVGDFESAAPVIVFLCKVKQKAPARKTPAGPARYLRQWVNGDSASWHHGTLDAIQKITVAGAPEHASIFDPLARAI